MENNKQYEPFYNDTSPLDITFEAPLIDRWVDHGPINRPIYIKPEGLVFDYFRDLTKLICQTIANSKI